MNLVYLLNLIMNIYILRCICCFISYLSYCICYHFMLLFIPRNPLSQKIYGKEQQFHFLPLDIYENTF